MARLPHVDRENVVTPQIQSSVSGADVAAASPFAAIAKTAGAMGDFLVDKADQYERGVALGVTANEVNAAQTDALSISEAAGGNVEAFNKAWAERSAKRLQGVPEKYRAAVEARFTEIGGDHARQIIAQGIDRDRKIATDRIDARQDSLMSEMTDLARSGQADSDRYKSLHNEYVGLLNDKISNPFFAYSQERANLDTQKAEDDLATAAYTGELERTYREKGYAAANARADQIMAADKTDGLNPVQKIKAVNAAKASIKATFQAETGAKTEFMAQNSLDIAALKDGSANPDDRLWDDKIAAAKELGLPGAVNSLQSARAFARTLPMSGMSYEESHEYGKRLLGGGFDAGRARQAIAKIESGGHYSILGPVLASGDRAYGKYQVMGANIPSWTEQALGKSLTPEQFLADPAAQDAVFDKIFGGYVAKFGNVADAASAWFTGRPLAEGGEAKDIFGTTGKGYASQFMVNYGEAGGADDDYVKGLVGAIRTQERDHLTVALDAADKVLDSGKLLDADQIGRFVESALMIADPATSERVAVVGNRAKANALSAGVPAGQITQLIDTLRDPSLEGDPLIIAAMQRQLQDNQKRRIDQLQNDPYSIAIERGFARPADAVDFSHQDAGQALQARVAPLNHVAETEGASPLPVLRPTEAKAFASAVVGPNAPAAYSALLSLDTDHLMATLGMDDVKGGIGNAARSNDPAKFSSAMTFLDAVWARSPLETQHLFGDDVIDSLQNWQGRLRYSTPEELAKQLTSRGDPQVEKRRKEMASDGQAIARKQNLDQVTALFDPPGLFNTPSAPVDSLTKDMLLGDYETVFGDRYAAIGDESKAREQTIQRMKNVWGRSDINGGRLTLYPPESLYPPVNGGYGWMKDQLDADLTARLGKAPGNYAIVSDRTTESEYDAHTPPSYLIAVEDPETGQLNMLSDTSRPDGLLRYRWDSSAPIAKARQEFEDLRAEPDVPQIPGKATPSAIIETFQKRLEQQ